MAWMLKSHHLQMIKSILEIGEQVCPKELHLLHHSVPLPNRPPLDLNLSIGSTTAQPPSTDFAKKSTKAILALQLHVAEQFRLAGLEKAYAEQVRELTRREKEMADQELASARVVMAKTREELEKVEKMKASLTGIEITCQACRQTFKV